LRRRETTAPFKARIAGTTRAKTNPQTSDRESGWLADNTDALEESTMLYYAIVFFVIALIAAALGFGGIAGAATGIAKILFFVFLILFIASLIFGGLRRR
jgi:uncharacterized membrane protein YtjA (UPF0391 family)